MILEKLLGSNYKWWYVAVYYYRLESAYLINNLFHFLGQSISIITAILIWGKVSSQSDTFTSVLLGAVLLALSSNTSYWIIGNSIKNGSLSRSLIQPNSILTNYFMVSVGFLMRIGFYYFVIFSPFILFYSRQAMFRETSPMIYLILLSCILMAFILRYLLSFLIGSAVFWTTKIDGQANFYENIFPLLAGVLYPFDIITLPWLKTILTLSPWSFVAYHPMQIYLGKYSQLQTLYVFLGGLAWCLMLYLLAKLVFKLGLKRYESVGL